jgi:hypothetical protein
MNNVIRLPNIPLVPDLLVEKHAKAIEEASAITMVIRSPDGVLTILWSQQPQQQLLYAVEALRHDVLKNCFGDQE